MNPFEMMLGLILITVGIIVTLRVKAKRRRALAKANGETIEPNRSSAGISLIVIAGLAALFIALGMDTTVTTPFGPVNNLGLMQTKQNLLIACGFVAVIGAILSLRK